MVLIYRIYFVMVAWREFSNYSKILNSGILHSVDNLIAFTKLGLSISLIMRHETLNTLIFPSLWKRKGIGDCHWKSCGQNKMGTWEYFLVFNFDSEIHTILNQLHYNFKNKIHNKLNNLPYPQKASIRQCKQDFLYSIISSMNKNLTRLSNA